MNGGVGVHGGRSWGPSLTPQTPIDPTDAQMTSDPSLIPPFLTSDLTGTPMGGWGAPADPIDPTDAQQTSDPSLTPIDPSLTPS